MPVVSGKAAAAGVRRVTGVRRLGRLAHGVAAGHTRRWRRASIFWERPKISMKPCALDWSKVSPES